MARPPFLAKTSQGKVLYLYLVVPDKALSVVLVKQDYKVKKPIYYVRKVLHGAELNYSTI